MSRRPTMGKATGPSRSASTAALTMPPPSRLPHHRAPSAQSVAKCNDDNESRPSSPKRMGKRPTMPAHRAAAGEGSGEINIQVVVRCRGRSSIELQQMSPIITSTEGAISKSITIETTPMATSTLSAFTTASSYGAGGPSTKTYPFDKVFGPEADQTMVFDEVAQDMLNEVLAGYNCTIFAYGQTGTGKTYTMQGDLELSPLNTPKNEAGIVPRVLHRLFSLLEAAENTEYSVKCSYVELYNEELRDLLSADYSKETPADRAPMSTTGEKATGGLKLFDDGKKGVMIQGLEEAGARNLKEALSLVNKGCQRRQTAETKMNTESSRSHTIFSITVHVKETSMAAGGDEMLKVGKFNLVDLAGSEAIGRSGATDKRAREAGMINQSLLTLGRVISALVDRGSHIPYRESKLTRLLQDSLGGKTKTCIVATVSPTRSNMEETLSTLDYAIRAKSIRNRPEVNQHLTKAGLLKEYVADMERLKADLLAAREKNGVFVSEERWAEMQDEQQRMKSEYDEARQRFNAISIELNTRKKEFDEVMSRFLATSAELEQSREAERSLGLALEESRVALDSIKARLDEEAVVSRAYVQGEERLHSVAAGLKSIANDGVTDVGGLFDKLARKAAVLGSNAGAANLFGGQVQTLTADIRQGLKKLHKVNGDFGKDVRTEVENFAKNGREVSQRDLDALDSALQSFDTLAAGLSSSIDQGHSEVVTASQAILNVKEDVQQSVREWAQGISHRSASMIEELLASQQENLSMVQSVLDSTADLVDAVISTARNHAEAERAAADTARKQAQQSAEAEISRLRASNLLLADLLQQEKVKTARLRTDLLGKMTSMIEAYTDAQDQSFSAVVTQIHAANEVGVSQMGTFVQHAESHWKGSSSRTSSLENELLEAVGTSSIQRTTGKEAVEEVRGSLRGALQVYGQHTSDEASRHIGDVDDYCSKISDSANGVLQTGSSRHSQQSEQLATLSGHVRQSLSSAKSNLEVRVEETQRLSSQLLGHQTSSSTTFEAVSREANHHLKSLLSSTADFLSEGILEDVPTGDTPKKRVWNVQQTWERTEPRDVLIRAFRERVASGGPSSSTETIPNTEEAETASLGRTESVASLPSVASAVSLPSMPVAEAQVTEVVLGLASSQLGKAKKGTGKGFGYGAREEKERPHVAPLGEQGGNIPRPRVIGRR